MNEELSSDLPEGWPAQNPPQPTREAQAQPRWQRVAQVVALAVISISIVGIAAGLWATRKTKDSRQYWSYDFKDITVESRASVEMRMSDKKGFERDLAHAGNMGQELVAVIPVPDNYSTASRVTYRLIFKRPAQFENRISDGESIEEITRAVTAEREAMMKRR